MPRLELRHLVRIIVLLIVTALAMAPTAHALPDQDAAEQAAREIAAAQDRANEAAAAFLRAESDLEVLIDDAARLEAEQAKLQARVDALRGQVEQAAVARFTSAGTTAIPLLTSYQDPHDQLQAEALTEIAFGHSAASFDEYDSAKSALDDKAEEAAHARQQVVEQRELYEQLREAALGQVVTLRDNETKRLEDERVRIALERQRREEQRRHRRT